MGDDVNATARVAVHQAVDGLVDARQRRFAAHDHDDTANDALSEVLSRLAVVALDGHRDGVEGAWQCIAAVAQGQLEQAMEDRAR